jgi:uncharacterized Fe-S cluster protein YjdI
MAQIEVSQFVRSKKRNGGSLWHFFNDSICSRSAFCVLGVGELKNSDWVFIPTCS